MNSILPESVFPSRLTEFSNIVKESEITEVQTRMLSGINHWPSSQLYCPQGVSFQDHIGVGGKQHFMLESDNVNNEMLISCNQVTARSEEYQLKYKHALNNYMSSSIANVQNVSNIHKSCSQFSDTTGEVYFAPNSLGGSQTNAIVTANKSSDKLVQNNNKINTKRKHSNAMPKEFLCIVCNKTYKTAWKNWHMKSHTAYESVACGICNKVVEGPDKLKTHTQFCHPPPSSSEYHGDEERIEEEKAKDQIKIASDDSQAEQGSGKEEAEGENKFFCLVCNLDCGSSELLEVHESGDSFFCRVCTAIFDSHPELKNHFFNHKGIACSVCRQVFYTKPELLHHKNTVLKCKSQLSERCKICGRGFVHRKSLETHMKEKHPNAKPDEFFCFICKPPKSYKDITFLNKHMRFNHTAFENLVCELCNEIIRGPEKLKIHMQNRHLQPSVSCNICQMVLSSKYTLRKHMEKHGEKIACDICGSLVNGKSALKQHMVSHERANYPCTICNLTFETKRKRRTHNIKVHNKSTPKPAVCELCGKVYKSKEVLKHHMATHSSEKPYVCEICGVGFKARVSLKTHGRTHSDIPKYKCSNCGEGFRWKQTFDKHVLNCEPHADEEMATEEETQ